MKSISLAVEECQNTMDWCWQVVVKLLEHAWIGRTKFLIKFPLCIYVCAISLGERVATC